MGKIKIGKSPGLEGMHPRILKEPKSETVDLLISTCNFPLKSAAVMTDWRVANTTPIF